MNNIALIAALLGFILIWTACDHLLYPLALIPGIIGGMLFGGGVIAGLLGR